MFVFLFCGDGIVIVFIQINGLICLLISLVGIIIVFFFRRRLYKLLWNYCQENIIQWFFIEWGQFDVIFGWKYRGLNVIVGGLWFIWKFKLMVFFMVWCVYWWVCWWKWVLDNVV